MRPEGILPITPTPRERLRFVSVIGNVAKQARRANSPGIAEPIVAWAAVGNEAPAPVNAATRAAEVALLDDAYTGHGACVAALLGDR